MEEGVKAQLLVELLSIYMHFYEKGNDQVNITLLSLSLSLSLSLFLFSSPSLVVFLYLYNVK